MDIQLANLKAISLCAKVPPYLPLFTISPLAFVCSIHFVGDIVKALSPASFLIPSNSRGLKSGLYKVSQIPRYSIVFLFLSQFPIGYSAHLI